MAHIEVEFEDGTSVRWEVSEEAAVDALAAITDEVGDPDTIKC